MARFWERGWGETFSVRLLACPEKNSLLELLINVFDVKPGKSFSMFDFFSSRAIRARNLLHFALSQAFLTSLTSGRAKSFFPGCAFLWQQAAHKSCKTQSNLVARGFFLDFLAMLSVHSHCEEHEEHYLFEALSCKTSINLNLIDL